MTSQPTVMQVDRERAAQIYRHFRDHDYAAWILAGENAGGDFDWVIQAFALHRHEAENRLRESDGWQDISTAPTAMCVMAARFDKYCGEWVYGVALSPPIYPFTHWRPLPAPPAALGPNP